MPAAAQSSTTCLAGCRGHDDQCTLDRRINLRDRCVAVFADELGRIGVHRHCVVAALAKLLPEDVAHLLRVARHPHHRDAFQRQEVLDLLHRRRYHRCVPPLDPVQPVVAPPMLPRPCREGEGHRNRSVAVQSDPATVRTGPPAPRQPRGHRDRVDRRSLAIPDSSAQAKGATHDRHGRLLRRACRGHVRRELGRDVRPDRGRSGGRLPRRARRWRARAGARDRDRADCAPAGGPRRRGAWDRPFEGHDERVCGRSREGRASASRSATSRRSRSRKRSASPTSSSTRS